MVYAEPHPIFYKYSERREQRQKGKMEFSQMVYAEPHPIFYKYRNLFHDSQYSAPEEIKTVSTKNLKRENHCQAQTD